MESRYYIRAQASGVLIDVLVAPRSSRSKIVGPHGDRLKVALAAEPIEGRANEELVALLKSILKVPKRSIEIVKGATSKNKTVCVQGLTVNDVTIRLESFKTGD